MDTETCQEEQLASFATEAMREKGMVAAAMGTTALSYDDKWWAVPVKMGDVARLVVIDTCSGASEVIVERDSIGHPEFHPNDSSLLRYAGPYYERMWVVNRDGSAIIGWRTRARGTSGSSTRPGIRASASC